MQRGRKKLPLGEKKKAIRVFVKAKHIKIAKIKLFESAKEFNQ